MRLVSINLGCPKNQVDLEIITGGLQNQVSFVNDLGSADLVLINTCAFIEQAKKESIDTIFDIASAKKDNPHLKIIVTGCLPQRYKDELANLIPEVDRFFLSIEPQTTLQQIQEYLQKKKSAKTTRRLLSPCHYAYLNIAQGCNNRCSYCAIPLIKGNQKSKSLDHIKTEALDLVEKGVKELIIIAQDTTSYGKDLSDNDSLPDVMSVLNEIKNLEWIRLLYTHPAFWSNELIDAINHLDKVVKYIDLPIQHISDAILKRMGRKVSRMQIEKLIDHLREKIDQLAIRTTVIVGFPGETQKQFEELIVFLEKTKFERLGSFIYSSEEGTRAAHFSDNIPERIKRERQEMITELYENISEERNRHLINKELKVLVDDVSLEKQSAFARSEWDAPEIDNNVILPLSVEPGTFYNVKITSADSFDLFAQVISTL